jgi:predicted metal-dependent phosphoesterase TrpH
MDIDFHTHPLNHRYYFDSLRPDALSERDKADILGLIDQGRERGLAALAVTDHDLALSGLWAAAEARRRGLPIRVLAGCECELYHNGEWIHILALNLKEPLAYTAYTPAAALVAAVRAQGAVAVLAHPMAYSLDVYRSLKTVVDGVEFRNGAQARRGADDFTAVLDADGYAGLRLCGSDYHWPDTVHALQWEARTAMAEDEFLRWFGAGR